MLKISHYSRAVKARLLRRIAAMLCGLYCHPGWHKMSARVAMLPPPLIWLAAKARNLVLRLTVQWPDAEFPRRVSTGPMNKIFAEVCLPYSRHVEQFLRTCLNHGFNETAFIALCHVSPGRRLGDVFIRFEAEIVDHIYCLLIMIRRGLEPKLLAPEHDAPEYIRSYRLVIESVAKAIEAGKAVHALSWLASYAAPPSFVAGDDYLQAARVFRQLEAMAVPAVEPLSAVSSPQGRLRVGVFRLDYNANGEVQLLTALLPALPPHVELVFTGFGEPPAAPLDAYPYVRLTRDDLAAAACEARALNLDAMIYSPPLWGFFGTPMTQLIDYRLAPVQIYYLGDVSTSGLKNLDYFTFPQHVSAVEYAGQFSETLLPVLWGLPPPPALFLPPAMRPSRTQKGLLYVTNCHIGKINAELIEAWTEILSRVPDSRLLLFPYPSAYHKQFAPLLERILRFYCRKSGIRRSAFVISEAAGPDNIRNLIMQGDVYLDSFPYSGAFSTVEALANSLPSVLYAGPAYFSQLACMVATIAGLDEDLVAGSVPDYIEKAVALGQGVSLRQVLAERIGAKVSPLSLPEANSAFSRSFWREAEQAIRKGPLSAAA